MGINVTFLGAAYTSTINSLTVTFTAHSEHEINLVRQFKAYVDSDSMEPSCTLNDPISKQPPYRCTIEGLSPATDYLVKSEYCLWSSDACFASAIERRWTLPTGEHSTWLTCNMQSGGMAYFFISYLFSPYLGRFCR